MSYTVLARKWRPQRFEDVIGQAHVSRSLMNALGMGRVAHAFLFSGTRGVGKTTTARILAKALNCEKGPAPSPCGECSSCLEVTLGTSVDVIEIDGASNTGVDNVRELRENAKYSPARGRYKIYIIDEVHMLSTAAFNALLKTLEEPPPHVVFIFATTDPHKLPATILSRCQHYDFRRVPRDVIQAHLKSLCEKENISAEDKALSRLATMAEGSVRDSLSLLDQVISYSGEGGLRDSDLDGVLGLVGRESVKSAARAIIAQDAASAVEGVDSLVDQGHDLRRFANELLSFFRDLMVVKLPDYPERALSLSDPEIAELKVISSGAGMEEVIRVMNLLSRLADEMKWSANPRISLELALIKAASRPVGTVDEVLAGIKTLGATGAGAQRAPRTFERPAPASAKAERTAPASKDKPREVREDAYTGYQEPVKAEGDAGAIEIWNRLAREVRALDPDSPVNSKITNCVPVGLKGDRFEINEKHTFRALKEGEISLIEETLTAMLGQAVKLTRVSSDKAKDKKSLGEIKQEKETSRKDKLRKDAMEEPIVKAAIDLFGGSVETVEESRG